MKKHEKIETIKYFPIRKKDLADFVEIIVENKSTEFNFSIITKIDTLSIEESSIEAFLDHKEVPDPLIRYWIFSAKYDLNHEIEKLVRLSILSKNMAELEISGLMKHGLKACFSKLINL